MSRKVLVLGATGAMGQYLVPELAARGYEVDAVSLDKVEKNIPGVRWLQADMEAPGVADEFRARHYDGIVDFMIYNTARLIPALTRYLGGATGHYIYLSSYRIYDNKEVPVRETSPRLLDSSEDVLLRNSDDYCIHKARGENIVRTYPSKDWTIVRPAITYSLMRSQLVTLEIDNTVGRAFAGKTVVLPEEARNIQGTMSWAGDVAQMIAGLLFNEKARGETFTVATAEHHTWGEIADYYRDICGLKAIWVPEADFLRAWVGPNHGFAPVWQLRYDRFFTRVMDNSKVLAATGMKQENLKKLYDGLAYEIGRCPRDFPFKNNPFMDDYLKAKKID